MDSPLKKLALLAIGSIIIVTSVYVGKFFLLGSVGLFSSPYEWLRLCAIPAVFCSGMFCLAVFAAAMFLGYMLFDFSGPPTKKPPMLCI